MSRITLITAHFHPYPLYGKVGGVKREIHVDSTVVAAGDQVSTDLGGEVAILNLEAGEYFGLDEVGKRVWELVQEPRRVSGIRDALLEEYDVEPERCEWDVISLLQEMADEDLIEVRDEDAG